MTDTGDEPAATPFGSPSVEPAPLGGWLMS
jgi:hypothetical protein